MDLKTTIKKKKEVPVEVIYEYWISEGFGHFGL